MQSPMTVLAESIADISIIAESLDLMACSTSETCNKCAAFCCPEMAVAFWACKILDCHCGTVNAWVSQHCLLSV